jgi:hypothetical protein
LLTFGSAHLGHDLAGFGGQREQLHSRQCKQCCYRSKQAHGKRSRSHAPAVEHQNRPRGSGALFGDELLQPPMTVSTSAKVTNLNSDKLDGQDSSAFLPVNGTAANPTNAANADELDGTSTFALPDMRGLEPDGVRYFICISGIYP